jgi:hypothetical protein
MSLGLLAHFEPSRREPGMPPEPAHQDERTFLLEAQHPDMEGPLEQYEEMTGPDGEPINPRLHVVMHGIIANQLLADDLPETCRRSSTWPGSATTGTT